MAAKTFRWIQSGALPGPANMALDEALASTTPPPPTVRVYRWDPWTLSLGCFQGVEEGDLEPFRAAGFGVTRRSTGGGAILHGDEVTYSVVLPADDPRIPRPVAASYDWLHGAVREALAAVGVPCDIRGPGPPAEGPDPFLCFARTAAIDLVAGERKVVGSAQRRTRTAFLQHGSILLSPGGIDPGVLEEALGRSFARVLGAEAAPGGPTEAEEAAARSLEAGKYGNREWILRPGRRWGRFAPPREAPPPLRVLGATLEPGALRILSSVGGSKPTLPDGSLRAADAALLRRVEERSLPGERDPWDSTFRRSLLGGKEAPPPARATVESVDPWALLLYREPDALLLLDLRRVHCPDQGEGGTLLRALLARAPGAARGPGACALARGAPPPLLEGLEPLQGRVRLLGS